MALFILVHGAGDTGWSWHRLAAVLRERGHEVIAPDLPGDDESLTLTDYADAVVAAADARRGGVVVGHSFGGFTAPIVAERLAADVLVMLAAMIPDPGERPDEWWSNTGFEDAVAAQAARDGGLTGNDDPHIGFYHDVPRALADEAIGRERAHPSVASMAVPWPLTAWPSVPTRFVVCAEDRFFPPAFLRDLARKRLGIVADEIEGSHCVALSRPEELASMLIAYAQEQQAS
ncbi:alpha/beta fold hydrolase [Microbacterium sp. Root280D1]|uniref:alpha/beta fold hydrolase n=1 Tax=Microbacterium sp. Root280D1 TaxID=1736510 RepID=UPI0006FEFD68|nr:alpha/beta hydrolase [Microbacterium sp. Root280D1]KRD51883.1 alpha/beta hydrolase [Microbacterium sp. Root280D1]